MELAVEHDISSQPLGGNSGLRLHNWLVGGREPNAGNDLFHPEGRNRDVVDSMLGTTGVLLTGRRTYDLVNGWGGSHPIPCLPVVVLTHSAPSEVPTGRSSFTVCTEGPIAAVATAQAKGRDVMVHGASTARQLLDANLADELLLHIAPILLGDGRPLFTQTAAPMELEQIEAVVTSQARADGLFSAKPMTPCSLEISKIDRSMPIVVGSEQISNCGNSPLKSRAQISAGLGGGFWSSTEEICA